MLCIIVSGKNQSNSVTQTEISPYINHKNLAKVQVLSNNKLLKSSTDEKSHQQQ